MDKFSEKWVDKYDPKNIDDLILNQKSKQTLKSKLESNKFFNITLHGIAGIGKTSTSHVLSNELNAIELFVACGLDGNINTIRTQVREFCEGISFDGRPKLVILDEIDGIIKKSQTSLKSLIYEHKDTMFILTTNYIYDIDPAILSRCKPLQIQTTKDDIYPRLKSILENEKIEYTDELFDEFCKRVVDKYYPDIRLVITGLEDCCLTGKLEPETELDLINGCNIVVAEIIKMLKGGKTPVLIREYIIDHESEFVCDYNSLASSMFRFLCNSNLSAKKLIPVADIVYRIDQVNDKEIQFFVLVNYLYELIQSK